MLALVLILMMVPVLMLVFMNVAHLILEQALVLVLSLVLILVLVPGRIYIGADSCDGAGIGASVLVWAPVLALVQVLVVGFVLMWRWR